MKNALNLLYKGYLFLDEVLKKIIKGFCGTALLVLTVVVFVGAISRTFFNHSFTGADEFAQYLMVWVVLFAAILCVEADDLVNVDVIFYTLPERYKPIIRIMANTVSCIFLVILSILAIDTVKRIYITGTHSIGLSFFPMWLLYVPTTFCFLLMGIEYGKLVIKGIQEITKLFDADIHFYKKLKSNGNRGDK